MPLFSSLLSRFSQQQIFCTSSTYNTCMKHISHSLYCGYLWIYIICSARLLVLWRWGLCLIHLYTSFCNASSSSVQYTFEGVRARHFYLLIKGIFKKRWTRCNLNKHIVVFRKQFNEKMNVFVSLPYDLITYHRSSLLLKVLKRNQLMCLKTYKGNLIVPSTAYRPSAVHNYG